MRLASNVLVSCIYLIVFILSNLCVIGYSNLLTFAVLASVLLFGLCKKMT